MVVLEPILEFQFTNFRNYDRFFPKLWGNIDISPKGRYVVPSILALISAGFGAWAVSLFSNESDYWFPFVLSLIFLITMFSVLFVSRSDSDKPASAPKRYMILPDDNGVRTLVEAQQTLVYVIEDLSEQLDDENAN